MKRMSQDKRSYNLAASTATLRWHGDTLTYTIDGHSRWIAIKGKFERHNSKRIYN